MDDKQIINLFFQRDEDAINAVDEKYGSKLNALAANMLQSREDGLECVNDTYMKAWNSIPPARPEYLFAFLAASARNIAIDMIRKNNAGKRQAKVVELTKELEECIGDGGLQTHLDKEDIGEMLSHFLETVDKNKRIIFLRRYWYSDSIKDISERMQMSESAVKVTLHRTRKERIKKISGKRGFISMKKSEAMDLYEGLNEISPQMIEEAGNYKKTASVDIRYKKSNNVKKIIAAGLVAAAAVTAVLGVRGLKPSVTGNGNQSSNQLASEQTGFKIAHVMNVYAAGLDDTSECIFSNDEKNAGVSGVVAGISSRVGDSSVMGQVMASINVTGEDISKIKYSIMGNDSDVTYNLARMKEVDKDSPEYQTSSEKFRKQTENGYAYYIIEDIGEEYEESGNSQSEGIQIVEFSKQLEKESLYQERQVYNEMVKNMYEGLTLSVTVTYEDGTIEIVDVGFKAAEGSDDLEKVSDKVIVYVK